MILKTFLNKINFSTLNVILLEIMEIIKIIIIIIIFNYIVGRDFLGLMMSIEQPKFQSEFKKNTILHPEK
jgi:hypothetical protein